MPVIQSWKQVGETPLQVIERAREQYRIPDGLKACYTCRLDPMAQGIITILFGRQIHQAPQYNKTSKVYRFQAILGVSTTSYDPMGRHTNFKQITSMEAERFQLEMLKRIGTQEQKLPPCSAYRYQGKPLWLHSLNGTLPAELPSKQITVNSVEALNPHPVMVPFNAYLAECKSDITDVKTLNPDTFKYTDILGDWDSLRDMACIDHIWRLVFVANVNSGTYIRSLVHDLGAELNIPAHAFRITRTKLGSISKTAHATHDS
jgi:tRNA pseudouridine55 synthase